MNGQHTGTLQVAVTTASGAVPIPNARVTVYDRDGIELYNLVTDESGNTQRVILYTPDGNLTYDPNYGYPAYAEYTVEVVATGFMPTQIQSVQIFDGVDSTLPVSLGPLPRSGYTPGMEEIIEIPENALLSSEPFIGGVPDQSVEPRVLTRVVIPEYITVHLGTPDSDARNVTVRFTDYLKNVASSEIYPTWPQNSLVANILCQISLVLNRIFTEWYPSRGYPFDITNSTRFDQAYVFGRNIFDSVSTIVDNIFNSYVKKVNSIAPYFTSYCNGSTVTCEGLSQWGTVYLANQGKSPLDILKYYYGPDIEIATSNNIGGVQTSYPGTPIKLNDRGENVRIIQRQLNRIGQNFPLIPRLIVDGVYQQPTATAVKVFQGIFNLPQTGIVDKATWYKLSYVYSAVTKLGELDAEAETENLGKPPTTTIRRGATGPLVKDLQFLLNYISDYYPTVPTVNRTGTFDEATERAVIEFQKTFKLTPDGVVGRQTWDRLYNVYFGILNNVNEPTSPTPPSPSPSPGTPAYPGTLLRFGSAGENVRLMQQYLNQISNAYPSIPKLTADGIFGQNTENAVRIFQGIFGLTPDGIIGRQTWDKVVEVYQRTSGQGKRPYPGAALRVGSRGDNVTYIQNQLNKVAKFQPTIPTLTADGIFGSGTERAVKTFQNIYGLVPDGIVGRLTWDKLNSLV